MSRLSRVNMYAVFHKEKCYKIVDDLEPTPVNNEGAVNLALGQRN